VKESGELLMMHGHGHRRILDTSATPVSSIKLRGIRLNIPDDRERGSASLIRRPRSPPPLPLAPRTFSLSRGRGGGPVPPSSRRPPSFFSAFFLFRPFSFTTARSGGLDVPKTGSSTPKRRIIG